VLQQSVQLPVDGLAAAAVGRCASQSDNTLARIELAPIYLLKWL